MKYSIQILILDIILKISYDFQINTYVSIYLNIIIYNPNIY